MTIGLELPFVDQPSLPESLQRSLQTQGEGAFSFCEPLFRPTIQALDLTDQQYMWLGGTTSWAAAQQTPAAVGRNSGVLLTQAQAGSLSGKIIRIRRMIVSNIAGAGAHNITWGIFPPLLAPATANNTLVLGSPRDSRHGTRTSLCQANFCTTLVSQMFGGWLTLQANQSIDIPLNLTFTDNTAGFFVTTGSANLAFNLGVEWEEREATKMELNR